MSTTQKTLLGKPIVYTDETKNFEIILTTYDKIRIPLNVVKYANIAPVTEYEYFQQIGSE